MVIMKLYISQFNLLTIIKLLKIYVQNTNYTIFESVIKCKKKEKKVKCIQLN